MSAMEYQIELLNEKGIRSLELMYERDECAKAELLRLLDGLPNKFRTITSNQKGVEFQWMETFSERKVRVWGKSETRVRKKSLPFHFSYEGLIFQISRQQNYQNSFWKEKCLRQDELLLQMQQEITFLRDYNESLKKQSQEKDSKIKSLTYCVEKLSVFVSTSVCSMRQGGGRDRACQAINDIRLIDSLSETQGSQVSLSTNASSSF